MKFDNTKDFLSFIEKSLGDGDFDSQIKRFAEGLRVKGKFEKNFIGESCLNDD